MCLVCVCVFSPHILPRIQMLSTALQAVVESTFKPKWHKYFLVSASDRARRRRARAELMSAVVAGGRLRQRGGGPSWDSSWIQEALRGEHACQGSGSDGVVPFEARAVFLRFGHRCQ